MSAPVLVLLGGGIDSVSIVRRANEMGLETVIVDRVIPSNYRGHWVKASCYHETETLAGLARWASQYDARPSGVLCAGTDAPDVMAAVAQEYRLPGPSVETAFISKNKLRQLEALRQAGVRVPETRIAIHPARYGMDTVLFKPATSRGARGVQRFAKDELIPITAVQRAAEFGTPVLVQQWIDGQQLSSESLVQNGEILWTAFADRNYARLEEFAPHVIEDGCDMPSEIPSFHERDWEAMAEEQLQKCVTAIGLQSGVLKGDLVWDGQCIHVIEVACRLSGGRMCSDITPEVWGVDFVGMAIRLALGDKIWPGEIRPYLRRHCSQRFSMGPHVTSHPERGPSVIGYGKDRADAQKSVARRLEALGHPSTTITPAPVFAP